MSNDGPGSPRDPDQLISVSGTLLFSAGADPFFRSLWKSDGTENGTVMIHYANPSAGGDVFQLRAMVANMLFYTSEASDGGELWKSNGTTGGTMRVKDVRPGSESSGAWLLSHVNGWLFFMANDGAGNVGFWKSDGTEVGTTFVHDAHVGGIGGGNVASDFVAAVGNSLFFRNWDPINGLELWKSDGTPAGTQLVKDILAGSSGSAPQALTDVNSTLFFTAFDDSFRRRLWLSDGSKVGPRVVKGIDYSSLFSESEGAPKQLTNVNGTLFFRVGDRQNGVELWKSDGTEAGTVLVRNIRELTSPHPNPPGFLISSNPDHLTNVNGTLFFTADDGVHGRELWKSDGTVDGTRLVVELTPGVDSTRFYFGNQTKSELLAVNDLLFFTAGVQNATGGFDNSLFVTDGTAVGTRALLTFENGVGPALIGELTFTGTHLFFRGTTQFGRPAALFAIVLVPEPDPSALIGLASIVIIASAHRYRFTRNNSAANRRVDDYGNQFALDED